VTIGLVLLVACTDQSATPPPTVPSTIAPLAAKSAEQVETVPTLFYPPGFVPADTRGVELPVYQVADLAQPPIPVFGGNARIAGTVFGPDGPVEGGVVRLERFVNGRGGYADVRTIAGGRWEASGVYGGHYRVRAWLKPNLATTEPQVGFVKDEENSSVDLAIGVEKHEAKRLQGALDHGDPQLGQIVILTVLHDQEDVNDDGIVVGEPLKDVDINLTLGEGWERVGEREPVRTGLDGVALFTIQCTAPGVHDVTVDNGEMSQTITLPECLSPDDPNASAPTTTDPGSTTSTSEPPFPIGRTFTTPYPNEIPAGTYTAGGERPNLCKTDYELYIFTGWQQMHQDGSPIIVPYPARNFTPSPGSFPCTFRRTA
jgi:hypothetical protein